MITLGKAKNDNINQMIIITGDFFSVRSSKWGVRNLIKFSDHIYYTKKSRLMLTTENDSFLHFYSIAQSTLMFPRGQACPSIFKF